MTNHPSISRDQLEARRQRARLYVEAAAELRAIAAEPLHTFVSGKDVVDAAKARAAYRDGENPSSEVGSPKGRVRA